MSKMLKSIVGLVIVGATIGLAAAPAKAESKIAQCKRFDQAMTVFNQQFSSKQETIGQSRTAKLDLLLNNSEKALKQLQSRQFSDPKIRSFQQSALNVFVQFHNDMADATNAIDRQNRPAAETAFKRMLLAENRLKQLDQRFHGYCGGAHK
jgi:hypothetical protein